MKISYLVVSILSSLLLFACDSTETVNGNNTQENTSRTENNPGRTNPADLTSVTTAVVSGDPGNYTFSVTIQSPDTGCAQYADWWEVIRPDGSLIYRRILTHSHVNEQPFTRSGGPVNITPDDEIIVRAHMNNQGYGEQVLRGSVNQGILAESLDASFAIELATSAPLPDGCAF